MSLLFGGGFMPEKPDARMVVRQCPHCEYTVRGGSQLARHIRHHHPEHVEESTITLKKSTIAEMISLVRGLNEVTGSTPSELARKVRETDLSLRIALRLMAMERVERILSLSVMLAKADRAFELKMDAAILKDGFDLDGLRKIQYRLEQAITCERKFLTDALTAGGESGEELVRKICKLFGSEVIEREGIVINQSKSLSVNVDPEHREMARQLLAKLGLGPMTDGTVVSTDGN